MTGKASNTLNLRHPIEGDFPPHTDRAASNAEFGGDPCHQTTLASKQRHPSKFHAFMLSTAERSVSSHISRTAKQHLLHAKAMEISRLIQASRVKRGWAQRKLAEEMGVSASAVAQWESGSTRPTIKNRIELAKLLDIPFLGLMPELSVSGNLSVDDQEIIAILQQLLELPSQVRRGLLMGAAATAAHFREQKPENR